MFYDLMRHHGNKCFQELDSLSDKRQRVEKPLLAHRKEEY